MAQKRPREAIVPLEDAACRSANPELETYLAIALREIGRTDEALVWLYRAIERQPVYARAFQELGNLLRAKRRYVEADSCSNTAWKQRLRCRNCRSRREAFASTAPTHLARRSHSRALS